MSADDPAAIRVRRGWTGAPSLVRVATMLACGLVAAVVVGISGFWGYAGIVGWDVAAVVFIVGVWLAVGRMNAAETAAHATRENPNRTTSDVILLTAAVASLAAVGYVLVRANSSSGAARDLLATLAFVSVLLSWFAVHTLYMLRYAQLYYVGAPGGVEFHQQEPPRYMDFAYLSFTIGMAFAVSDNDLENGTFRAAALRQALLSYLFGVVILGAMINLIAGLGAGSH